jgi:cysteine desulfurase/selenocysteine lyase
MMGQEELGASREFDIDEVRRDFPILAERVNGRELVFLDSAASTQRPRQVLDAIRRFETSSYSNVHRGVHTLSQRSTEAYESARAKVRGFLNARAEEEIIFTSGATDAINLVASTYGRRFVKQGDEIVVSVMEHHSNIVPWQMLCEDVGAELKVIPVNEAGELDLGVARDLVGERTKLVCFGHVSNALGSINPIHEIVEMAKACGARTLVDGAQAVPHFRVDVQKIDCDFYVFSGHKIYGPNGIGVLYGKHALLESMPPWKGGGDMIASVSFDGTVYSKPPAKFEAGTPNITGAVGMGFAIDYLLSFDWDSVEAHEADLLAYGHAQLTAVPGLRMVGTAAQKTGVFSFVFDGINAQDIGTILDQEGVAVRVGHHCAQPVMDYLQVPGTVRASLGIYNTRQDIDRLVQALRTAVDLLA